MDGANGSSAFMSPVVQGKNQHDIMNNMQNHNVGNKRNVPITGASLNGGAWFSGNSVNGPQRPQAPNHSNVGIGGNATFS